MTAFDIIVLTCLAGGAVFGFRNGFVQESLSLIAWVATLFTVRLFHSPVTAYLTEPVGNAGGASTLALIGLYLITYLIGRWIARAIGRRIRTSVLGPIDRVLGFGFGALKGLIIATLGFLLTVTVLDFASPGEDRPEWLTASRTYPLMNASSNALLVAIEEQRAIGGFL